jgi:2-methylcitrate dehydratase PrpD
MLRYGEYEEVSGQKAPTSFLAKYAAELKYNDIPDEVVDKLKQIVLHGVGAMLSANPTTLGKRYINLAKDFFGAPKEATIFGDGSKVSLLGACYANGALGDVMDWEDFIAPSHTSCIIIPPVFAFAETRDKPVSGKEAIVAMTAAYDVKQRIERAIIHTDETFEQNGMPVSHCGSMGVAIAVGKLLKFDADKMATAIGIGGQMSHPDTNISNLQTRADSYHGIYGWTAVAGMLAAQCTRVGVRGFETILDGDKGWHKMLGFKRVDWDAYFRGETHGKKFAGVAIDCLKRWPAEAFLQIVCDDIDYLVKKYSIKPEEIEEINVTNIDPLNLPKGFPEAVPPKGLLDAQFNAPYVIANCAYQEDPVTWYDEEKYSRRDLLNLAGKVRVVGKRMPFKHSYKVHWDGSWVKVVAEIIVKDGKKYKKVGQFYRGHWRNPMSWEELQQQFKLQAVRLIGKEKAEKAIQQTKNLENIDDITEIIPNLAK